MSAGKRERKIGNNSLLWKTFCPDEMSCRNSAPERDFVCPPPFAKLKDRWAEAHLWCLIIAKPSLALRFRNKQPRRFRDGRPFTLNLAIVSILCKWGYLKLIR